MTRASANCVAECLLLLSPHTKLYEMTKVSDQSHFSEKLTRTKCTTYFVASQKLFQIH